MLTSFLLNSTWLRTEAIGEVAPCLAAWNAPGGPRANGVVTAATEAAAMCGGSFEPGAPTTSSFIHGFFSIAQLGQFARAGVGLVARWGIPDLFDDRRQPKSGSDFDTALVASDLFLYVLYNSTVGPGNSPVLGVTGDEHSAALVYAHCASSSNYGTNGTVTIFAANPSESTVALKMSVPTRPRVTYLLTPAYDGERGLAAKTPVLNGDTAHPLSLDADGSLPRMDGEFCGEGGERRVACMDTLVLPPRSQGFFVLLGAASAACRG